MQKTSKAFTLIEIMVTVVIIGAIAAAALVGYRKTMGMAYERRIMNNMRLIIAAYDIYFIKRGFYPPDGLIELPTIKTRLQNFVTLNIEPESTNERYEYRYNSATQGYELIGLPAFSILGYSCQATYTKRPVSPLKEIICVKSGDCKVIPPSCF